MIEQLWYTWSTAGLGSVTGFRVRAASPGLLDIHSERFRALEPFLRYDLPAGTDPYEATAANSPCDLALLEVGNKRILLQKVYVGKDAYNRPGVHFIHLLEGLPSTFLASDAIQLWQSPFWQSSDQTGISCELPSMENIQINKLSARTLARYNLAPIQEDLVFTIQAYLSLAPYQRLYLAAPAEQVAALIWGLTRCLPFTMQEKLTFSTYENDVHDVDAHIIGTCWSPGTQYDLASECYNDEGLALNSFSDKRSVLIRDSLEESYARFAVKCMVDGQEQRLKELLNTANGMRISTPPSFLVLYDLFTAKNLTREQITSVLQRYELAAGLLRQENIQDFILQLTCDDSQWWRERGEHAIKELRSQRQNNTDINVLPGLNALAERAATSVATALLDGETRTEFACFKVLFASAPPTSNPDPWIYLLHRFAVTIEAGTFDPFQLKDWDTRTRLLINWKEVASSIEDQLILPWLQVAWSELKLLLALPLPEHWHILAITDLLKHSSDLLTSDIATVAIVHSALFERSLKSLMHDIDTQSAALNLFATLAKQNYPGKMSMLFIMLRDEQHIETLLQAALLTDKEKVELFESHAQMFLALNPLPAQVIDLISVYLSCLTFHDLSNAAIRQILKLLQRNSKKLPVKDIHQVRDWNFACDAIIQEQGVKFIEFDVMYLDMLGNAIHQLQLQNEKEYLQKLFSSLSKSVNTEEELRSVTEVLAPTIGISFHDFLYQLAQYRGKRYNSSLPQRFLLPYIIYACEHANKMQPGSKKQFILPVLRALLKNVDRSAFDSIERETKGWPSAAYEEWRVHNVGLRPTGMMTRIGDNLRQFFPTMPQTRTSTRQNTPQTSSQTVVAQVWLQPRRSISYDTLAKMYKLQTLYLPSLRSELQKMTPKPLWINDEQDVLWQLDDPRKGFEETREMLINYEFILDELEHGQVAERNPRSILAKMQEEAFQQVKKQENYKLQFRKAKDRQQLEKDVKEMLGIFLCHHYLAQYLWEQKKRMPDWLGEQKKSIQIDRSKNLSFIDRE